jgi:hypothetical protein
MSLTNKNLNTKLTEILRQCEQIKLLTLLSGRATPAIQRLHKLIDDLPTVDVVEAVVPAKVVPAVRALWDAFKALGVIVKDDRVSLAELAKLPAILKQLVKVLKQLG